MLRIREEVPELRPSVGLYVVSYRYKSSDDEKAEMDQKLKPTIDSRTESRLRLCPFQSCLREQTTDKHQDRRSTLHESLSQVLVVKRTCFLAWTLYDIPLRFWIPSTIEASMNNVCCSVSRNLTQALCRIMTSTYDQIREAKEEDEILPTAKIPCCRVQRWKRDHQELQTNRTPRQTRSRGLPVAPSHHYLINCRGTTKHSLENPPATQWPKVEELPVVVIEQQQGDANIQEEIGNCGLGRTRKPGNLFQCTGQYSCLLLTTMKDISNFANRFIVKNTCRRGLGY